MCREGRTTWNGGDPRCSSKDQGEQRTQIAVSARSPSVRRETSIVRWSRMKRRSQARRWPLRTRLEPLSVLARRNASPSRFPGRATLPPTQMEEAPRTSCPRPRASSLPPFFSFVKDAPHVKQQTLSPHPSLSPQQEKRAPPRDGKHAQHHSYVLRRANCFCGTKTAGRPSLGLNSQARLPSFGHRTQHYGACGRDRSAAK